MYDPGHRGPFSFHNVLATVDEALVTFFDEVNLVTKVKAHSRKKRQHVRASCNPKQINPRLISFMLIRSNLTTALTAAFIPCESPPLVKTAMPRPPPPTTPSFLSMANMAREASMANMTKMARLVMTLVLHTEELFCAQRALPRRSTSPPTSRHLTPQKGFSSEMWKPEKSNNNSNNNLTK